MESANAAPVRKPGRRKYLIDRGFQLKYTLIMIIVGAAISILFGAMMYEAHKTATELIDLPNPYRGIVEAQDTSLLWLVMAISVVMAIALGLFGILVTHRVAGPIYVFSHYMDVLGRGRFPMLRPLRKNDELKSFFDVFNQAVATMRERSRSDGEELKKLAATLERVGGNVELKAASERLRTMSVRLLDAALSVDPATPGQKAEAAAKSA